MTESPNDALSLSGNVLHGLTWLNRLFGVAILVLLIASVVAEGPVMRALGVRDGPGWGAMVTGGRLIMVLGIGGVALAQVVLKRLLDLVETVRLGDPFVAENATRLRRIAWAVLGLEALHLAIGSVARYASQGGQLLDIDWGFSVARSLTVLLLFVLAQVFEHGTRMREDLQGTV